MKKLSILFLAVLMSCIAENSPPVCKIVMPAEGSEYARGESIEINVSAIDEDGDIAEVRLLIDEIGISSLGAFPYNFVYSSEDMEVGTHSIKAEAVDDNGKESEDIVSVVIKSALPEVETAQPTAITSNSAVLGGTIINDGGGTITKAGVIWGIEPYNGTDFNELSADVTGTSFSITLEDLQNENYFVIAFAENEIGRSYGEQINFNTLPQENTPPVCEIMLPLDGTLYTRGEDIEINVNAMDEDGGIAEVRLYIDDIGISSLNGFPFSFTYSSEEMMVGIHSIRVEAMDNVGALSVDSVRVVIKAALPVVETSQPASITTNSAVVGGTITDDGGSMISTAGILLGIEPNDGTFMIELSADVTDHSFSITLNDLEYENYYVIAFAENASGRSYGEQVSLQTLLPEDMFIDHRDGNAYKWVAIGPQIWMAENLAYLPELRNPNNYSDTIPFYYVYGYYGFKVGEAKTTFNYNTYGVLYNYPAATDACPDGWRLPTSDEEQALISYIGGEDEIERILDVGTDHWNTNPAGNNSTGFTALGAGWTNLEDNGTFGFENLRTTAGFWKVDTCSQDSLNGIPYIIESGNPFRLNDLDCAPFANGYSVRCIKE